MVAIAPTVRAFANRKKGSFFFVFVLLAEVIVSCGGSRTSSCRVRPAPIDTPPGVREVELDVFQRNISTFGSPVAGQLSFKLANAEFPRVWYPSCPTRDVVRACQVGISHLYGFTESTCHSPVQVFCQR